MVVTTTAICQEMALACQADNAARAEARAPKMMTMAYPTSTPDLCRLCAFNEDNELPPFWRHFVTIGGKNKDGALSTLQRIITERAAEATSTQVAALVPTALFECISQFRLGGEVDNVLDGLTPFMIVPPNYH